MLWLCAISLFSLLPLAGAFDLLAERFSVRSPGLHLRNNLKPGDILIQYILNYPSLRFYAGADSELLEASVIPGTLNQETRKEFFLYQVWGGAKRVFLLIGRDRDFLTPLPGEVYDLYATRYFMVLSNRGD
jgi:hypothetical protein